jgi:hypothetical protein
MQGFIRAIARLAVMGAVMAAVLVGAIFAGLGTTTAIAVGVVLAGVVGLVGVVRRPRTKLTPTEQIEAMLAADPLDRQKAAAAKAAAAAAEAASHAPSPTATTGVESMAPQGGSVEADPEAGMPRWRRPSLLEARRSDPTRGPAVHRMPMRFGEGSSDEFDIRLVRYAVVPVLDRPDEVLGLRLSDLGSGDEVHVIGASGAFVEVMCPNGDQGFVHRTTLGQRGSAAIHMPQEADDAMTALLTARGLI